MDNRPRLFAALALALTFSAAPFAYAAAPGASKATLTVPVAQPIKVTIDGRKWICEGASCAAEPSEYADIRAPVGECSRVAKKLGASFTAYEAGKKTLSEAELASCNNAVKLTN